MDATQSGVIPIAYEYETPIIASNAREKFMVQNADCVLAITDADKNNFINTYDLDRDKVRVFPVGVNHGNYETGIEGSLDGKIKCLITGSLWFGPNSDGAKWFILEHFKYRIWPIIHLVEQ